MNAQSITFQRFTYSQTSDQYGSIAIDLPKGQSTLSVSLVRENGTGVEVDPSQYSVMDGQVVIGDLEAFHQTYGTDFAYVFIQRKTPLVQSATFQNGRYLDVRKVEGALDDLSMQIQDIAGRTEGVVRVPMSEMDGEAPRLPSREARAGMVLGFDEEGNIVTPYSVDGLRNDLEEASQARGQAKDYKEAAEMARDASVAAQTASENAQGLAEGARNDAYQAKSQAAEISAGMDVEWRANIKPYIDQAVSFIMAHKVDAVNAVETYWTTEIVPRVNLLAEGVQNLSNDANDKLAELRRYFQETVLATLSQQLDAVQGFVDGARMSEEAASGYASEARGYRNEAEERVGNGVAQAEEYASQAAASAAEAADQVEKTKRYYKPQIAEDGYITWTASGEGMEPIDGSDVLVSRLTAVLDALETLNSQVGLKIDGAYVEDGYLTLTSNGVPVVSNLGPFSGTGGGGGSSSGSTMSISSLTGWTVRTFSEGSAVKVRIKWTSMQEDGSPTGPGALKVSVNGKVVLNGRQIDQLEEGYEIDITQWLSRGSNSVVVSVTDAFGSTRSILFSVTLTQLLLTSRFDESTPITTDTFSYTFTPTGKVEKTMHFLIDGTEVATLGGINASGSQQKIDLPAPVHGGHVLEAYFTCEIDGVEVPSPVLRHCLICVRGEETPVVASSFMPSDLKQYEPVNIPYYVYVPGDLQADVVLSDGTYTWTETGLDRTLHTWTYTPEETGDVTFSITCGAGSWASQAAAVEPSEAQVSATEGAVLYLTARNKVSSDRDWSYGEYSAQLEGFNWISNGWMADSEGYPILRLSGNAKATIGYDPFDTDLKGTSGGKTGRTIEFEFASSNAQDYDAVIMSCMKDGVGFEITPQSMTLKSLSRSITRQYKENEHVRVTMVIESLADFRLIYIYLNGILCGIDQYPTNDTWLHPHTDITIGSDLCTTDIYSIRCYDKALSRREVLNNYLSDIPNAKRKVEEYFANQIFDEYGAIDCEMLPPSVPYVIIRASRLSENKKDELECSVSLVTKDEAGVPIPSRSFTIEHGKYKVQGTSSEFYMVKNFKFYPDEDKDGRYLLGDGTSAQGFAVSAGGPQAKVICLKADYASSEGANNIVLAKLFEDINPFQSAPQQSHGSMVRQGIDGFPCAVFFDDGTGPKFYCKANFNIDKDNPEIFGFSEGDESWETKTNNGDWARFINTDFSNPLWENDFEARYPEDNKDTTNLQAFAEWVASTDTMKATNEPLDEEVTLKYAELDVKGEYGEYDHVFTIDSPAYRLARFRNELKDHVSDLSSCFYFVFTEFFLMIDSRVKNSFPTFFHDDPKWMWPQYDMDTAMGINNNGVLVFGYDLESEDNVFNGYSEQDGTDSVFWRNFRQAFAKEIQKMYNDLRGGKLTYDLVEERFEKHQSAWPVAMWNEDAYRKYVAYITEDGNAFDDDIASMCQGSKSDQRKFWLYGRTRYEDSKYMRGDPNATNTIKFRANAVPQGGIEIVPYIDMYVNLKAGEYNYKVKASKGEPVTIVPELSGAQNTDFTIFTADQIKAISDLSGFNPEQVNILAAERLQELTIGSSKVNSRLTALGIGNNPLLRKIDAHNCPNLKTSIDATNCPSLVYADFSGTGITQLQLANGGIVETLMLPDTINTLELLNQPNIKTLKMPGFQNITYLRCEGMASVVNEKVPRMFNDLPDGAFVRVIGFNLRFQSYQDAQDLVDNLARFQGIDENGVSIPGYGNAKVSGTVTIPYITASQKTRLESYGLNVISEGGEVEIAYFCNWDGTILRREFLVDGTTSWAGSTPQREPVGSTGYTFKGWTDVQGSTSAKWTDNTISGLTGKDEYYFYAVYTTYTRKIVATFFGFEGVPLNRFELSYGSTASRYAPTLSNYSGYGTLGFIPPVYKSVTEETDYYAVYNSEPTREILRRGYTFSSRFASQGASTFNESSFSNIEYIRGHLFRDFYYLSSVSFPICSYVGEYAFYSCGSLRSVYLPKCREFAYYAFGSCPSLTTLYAPECDTLGSWAISGNKLTSLTLSDKLKRVYNRAFYSVSGTLSATYNLDECEYLGEDVATNCNGIVFDSPNGLQNCTYIGSYALKGGSKFQGTKLDLQACSYIGYQAFYENSYIEDLHIYESTDVVGQTFQKCTNLKRITIDCDLTYYRPDPVFPGQYTIRDHIFQSCSSVELVKAPKLTNGALFTYCTGKAYLGDITSGVTYLSNASFSFIRLENTVVSESLFLSNKTIKTVVLPNCISIGSSAFYGMSGESLYLGGSKVVPYLTYANQGFAYFNSIYVRASLVDAYKTTYGWSVYSSRYAAFDFDNDLETL